MSMSRLNSFSDSNKQFDDKDVKTDSSNSEFARAENEDDDGYDPWSDRRPEPEPLFERDPWN